MLIGLLVQRVNEIKEFIELPWEKKKKRLKELWAKYGRLYILLFIAAALVAFINVYLNWTEYKKLNTNNKQSGGATGTTVESAAETATGTAVESAVETATGTAVESAAETATGSATETASANKPAAETATGTAVESATETAPETTTKGAKNNENKPSAGNVGAAATATATGSNKGVSVPEQPKTTQLRPGEKIVDGKLVNENDEKRNKEMKVIIESHNKMIKEKNTAKAKKGQERKSTVSQTFNSIKGNVGAAIDGGMGKALTIIGKFFMFIVGLILFCSAPVVLFYMWMKKLIMPMFPTRMAPDPPATAL